MKRLLIFCLVILTVIVATALTFNKQIKDVTITHNSKQELKKITKLTYTEIKNNQEKSSNEFSFKQVDSISWESVISSTTNDDIILGEIYIPSIQLNLIIFKGLSNSALSKGSGTMKENQVMGEKNYALAGHDVRNSEALFSKLKYLSIDDNVYITNLEHIYMYKVRSSKVDLESNVESIRDIEGKNELTLVTCAEEGKKRLIIHCDFIEEKLFENDVFYTLP